ncbi:MAG: KEOPS complex subunit Pcc1 [Candidatus Woesearchaeota archaeon]
MDYKGEIIINFGRMSDKNKEAENLYQALFPELNQEKRDRSELFVDKLKDKIRICIVAADSVALRASLNNITKLLTVYEKMNK